MHFICVIIIALDPSPDTNGLLASGAIARSNNRPFAGGPDWRAVHSPGAPMMTSSAKAAAAQRAEQALRHLSSVSVQIADCATSRSLERTTQSQPEKAKD